MQLESLELGLSAFELSLATLSELNGKDCTNLWKLVIDMVCKIQKRKRAWLSGRDGGLLLSFPRPEKATPETAT